MLGSHNFVGMQTPADIVTLNLSLSEPLAFPVIWTLSHALYLVWHLRFNKKTISRIIIRAELEARINILRKSRLATAAEKVGDLLEL